MENTRGANAYIGNLHVCPVLLVAALDGLSGARVLLSEVLVISVGVICEVAAVPITK